MCERERHRELPQIEERELEARAVAELASYLRIEERELEAGGRRR